MKKCIVAILIVSAFINNLKAQSYHFSQFYSTPLLTNPANTGFINGAYRLASISKRRALLETVPILLVILSADVSVLRDKLGEGNKLGVGLYLMNDQSLNGALKTNAAGISVGYNIVLDENGYYSLGVGMQGTFHQRTIDYARLSFESQYTAQGYSANVAGVDVPWNNYKKKYMDVNVGIMYHANLENQSFFAGAAVYNTARHKENYLSEEFAIPLRYTFQAGGRLDISSTGSVYFSVTQMRQSKATETTGGIAYGIILNEDGDKEIDFGAWYRYKDALIPYIGFQTHGFQVGLTYDQTVSNVKAGASVRNGYELTLLFNAKDNRELNGLFHGIKAAWFKYNLPVSTNSGKLYRILNFNDERDT